MKAPQLRNVELTGPYFHTGSYLTLRQIVDFYMRGGDFPITNAEDRDPNLVNIGAAGFGFGSTNAVSPPLFWTAYRMSSRSMTLCRTRMPRHRRRDRDTGSSEGGPGQVPAVHDRRARAVRASTLRPSRDLRAAGWHGAGQYFATRNTILLQSTGANPAFRRVPPVGAGGAATPLPSFLGISRTPVPGPNNDHFDR